MAAVSRILLFAFACDPSRGSEPGAGATVVKLASALADEVYVISRKEEALSAKRLAESLGENVHVIQTGVTTKRLPTYIRYLAWIFSAVLEARTLRRTLSFDVVHHATYASDWFVNPLVFMRKRTPERWVWGPAGGASYAPYSVGRAVTRSHAFGELIRRATTVPMRVAVHRATRGRVDVAIALNVDSDYGFRRAGFGTTVVKSNAVLNYAALPMRRPAESPLIVYAGRGVPWKGLPLLLTAMADVPHHWRLIVAGPDTNTDFYRNLAGNNTDRIDFVGALDRDATLALFAQASAVALPSLHDSAPWAAAEAAGIGTPVVCLDLGGVAAMAGALAVVVPARPTRDLPRRFADALVTASAENAVPDRSHTEAALKRTLAEAYALEHK